MPDINTDGNATETTSTLAAAAINWAEEWKRLQAARCASDDPNYWNERAKSYPADERPSPYVQEFLRLAQVLPGETVFDMGCGSGALAIPLGLAGHKVVAADFSQAMLGRMQEQLDQQGIRTVFPKLMSWEEDWAAKGVREGMVDVCFASRSIATSDLRDSLMRLHEIARRRVCVTLATAASPRIDERIMKEIGIEDKGVRDYVYAINILINEGILPEVSYIKSTRFDTFDDVAEACLSLRRMIDGALPRNCSEDDRNRAYERLDAWLQDNLETNPEAGLPDSHGSAQKELRLTKPRVITWAFIAWNKEK